MAWLRRAAPFAKIIMPLLTAPEWQCLNDALFLAVVRGRGHVRYQLRVEALPDKEWQWAAWRLSAPDVIRSGQTGRLRVALEKARLAAHSLAMITQPQPAFGWPATG